MKLFLGFLFLSFFSIAQESPKVSGIVGNGVTYTYQYMDVTNDTPLTEIDTIQSEFQVIISESQKFIQLTGIPKIDSLFAFDSLTIENLMENEALGGILKDAHYTQRNDISFEVNYIDQIIKGGYHPIIVKWMYDELWNSIKLFIAFTQNGQNHYYSFYLDEVVYLGWDHEITYSRQFDISSYGEMNSTEAEEVEIFKAFSNATFTVNDTALIIQSEKINLDKAITRSFNTNNKSMYMVNGALFSIPKHSDWIFYSFNFNKDKGNFEGYYYFEIKKEE